MLIHFLLFKNIRNAGDNSPLKIFQSGSGQKANTNIPWTLPTVSSGNFADHKIAEFHVYGEIHSQKAGEGNFLPGHGRVFLSVLSDWSCSSPHLLGLYPVGLAGGTRLLQIWLIFKHTFVSNLNVEQFRTSWQYFDILMTLFYEFKARAVSWGKH